MVLLPVANQKQPSRGFFTKRYSKNVQQICRRAPVPKCDFNKVALQLYQNHALARVKYVGNLQNTRAKV